MATHQRQLQPNSCRAVSTTQDPQQRPPQKFLSARGQYQPGKREEQKTKTRRRGGAREGHGRVSKSRGIRELNRWDQEGGGNEPAGLAIF